MTLPRRQNPLSRLAAMRGTLRNALLVCAFALTLAGCGDGDDGTIPPDDAGDLLAVLAAVERYAEEGNCDLAQKNAAELINQVNALPNDVDPKVASELTKASDHLRVLASDPDNCTETGTSGITGLETTDTTDTEEPPETTVTETTTPEEETTTDEQPPEDENTEPPTGQGQDEGNQGGGQTEGGGVEPSSGGVTPSGGGG